MSRAERKRQIRAKRQRHVRCAFGRTASLDQGALVERPLPGAAPTAFRIWQAGENPTDKAIAVFTPESAARLLVEQEIRGNRYSIDFDHLSLTENRPAEAGRAAGWHRLEVRKDANGKPELWAVGVEWCADAKAGLEEDPPRWRYFSPAFDLDVDTGEVISYTNTALCINPATWNNTELATRSTSRGTTKMKMTKAQRAKLAVLAAMHATMSDEASDGDCKAAAEAMFKVNGGPDEFAKLTKLAEGDGDDEEAPKSEKTTDEAPPSSEAPKSEKTTDEAPPTSRSPGGEKTTKAAEEPPAEKTKVAAAKATRAGGESALVETVAVMAKRLEQLEAEQKRDRDARRAASVASMLASRKDISAETRASLKDLRPSQVRSILATIPKPTVETQRAKGTRGAEQGTGGATTAPAHVDARVRAAMGLPTAAGPVAGFGEANNGKRVFHTVRPSEWRATKAAKSAEKVS